MRKLGILFVLAAVFGGGGCDGCGGGSGGGGLPPDPSKVASKIDRTVATDFYDANKFLFSGNPPVQTGVAADTITRERIAVLRGRVLGRGGGALSGVRVGIVNHPEFGGTLTRSDGRFDLAVNSGSALMISLTADGSCAAQRQVNPPPRRFTAVKDVVMIPRDSATTQVNSGGAGFQVARASATNDADGKRQATLVFPPGMSAMMQTGAGEQPLSTLHVRATEFTVGGNGPNTMPASLPPSSAYTYAVDLSVDEAVKAGATGVKFDRPVAFYVENFLHFPVGGIVPSGYYDPGVGAWVASANGRVIGVVDTGGGMAQLDLDGDGAADGAAALAALGIDDGERERLATLYQPGQSLWRVPISHFSAWDCNWPYQLPGGAIGPDGRPIGGDDDDDPCQSRGSIIGCENQALGEAVPVDGTPYWLHYQSDRVKGRRSNFTVNVPLSGASLPASLKRIDLEIDVAGQHAEQSFSNAPDQSYAYVWDGKDSYGRLLQGRQPVHARISYVYDGVYGQPNPDENAFATSSGLAISGDRARQEISLSRDWDGSVGGWDSTADDLGGWSLSPHHVFDVAGQVLEMGDGQQLSGQRLAAIITSFAGVGTVGSSGDGGPAQLAQISADVSLGVGPDDSVYLGGGQRIRRVGTDGVITTLAGSPGSGDGGEGVAALDAQIATLISNIVFGPDGSLYFAENDIMVGSPQRVRRIGPDGIINTVAGNGARGFGGDGGPALQAVLGNVAGIALGPDGSLYLADSDNSRIRRVGADGIIRTVAGGGANFVPWANYDGSPATGVTFTEPNAVVAGADGSFYFSDFGETAVFHVTADGILHVIAGTQATFTSSGDGGPASAATLSPVGLALARDGGLFVTDLVANSVRYIDPITGIINTVAGNGTSGFAGDGGPGPAAELDSPFWLALDSVGTLYVSGEGARVRRLGGPLAGLPTTDFLVPTPDTSEIYLFDRSGRHLSTLDPLTGAARLSFVYDGAGRLASLSDADGNRTTVERDSAGRATAIVGPYGARTELAHGSNDYLSRISYADGAAVAMSYDGPGGLLQSFTDERGSVTQISYDADGRLQRETDAEGGFRELARDQPQPTDSTVTLTTALGRKTRYRSEQLGSGQLRRTFTPPTGSPVISERRPDGSTVVQSPDGTIVETVLGPDRRFGMLAPVAKSMVISTPAGHKLSLSSARTATLRDPTQPLMVQTAQTIFTINGRTFTSNFDAATRTAVTITPMGRSETVTLDDKGHASGVAVTGLNAVGFSYDSHGRLSRVTQANRVTTWSYDTAGHLSQIVDPLGRTVQIQRDGAGRVTGETLPDGSSLGFSHDAAGAVTALTPPSRPATKFGYDALGLLTSFTLPPLPDSMTPAQLSYDADHQQSSLTRPDGVALQVARDSAGRISGLTFPGGQITAHYSPSADLLDGLSAGSEVLQFGYDGALLTDVSTMGTVVGAVHRTYDDNLQMASETVNGAMAAFSHDGDGLLTGAGALTLARDAQTGAVNSVTLGSFVESYTRDGFGALSSRNAAAGATALSSATYTRDAVGRVTHKSETIAGETHGYDYAFDMAGRLTEVKRDGAVRASYGYDANGNRTSQNVDGVAQTASYDAQDRLMQLGAFTFSYSADGRLQSRSGTGGATQYEWDGLGRLSGVLLANGTHVQYVVDGLGRRIAKRVNGVLKQELVYGEGLLPLAELDGSGALVRRFVYGANTSAPSYVVEGGVAYAMVTDQVGSPRLVVDSATGVVAQRLDYDEFGGLLSDSMPTFQPFGFAGGIQDRDTGLVHFGAREYDPQSGRFISRDPVGFGGGQSNAYLYAIGDPVNLADPSGRDFNDWLIRHQGFFGAIGDLASGFANTITFGGVGKFQQLVGIDSEVNPCSGWYMGGGIAGDLWLIVVTDELAGGGGEEPPEIERSSASDPVGRRGNPLEIQPGTNAPETIDGRDYTGHALDRMQGRGMTPSVIENTIESGTAYPGNMPGTIRYFDPVNGTTAIVDSASGRVITVY